MKNSKVLKNDTRCHIIEYDLFLIRDQRLHKDCGVIVSCRGNTLSYEKNHIQTKNHIRRHHQWSYCSPSPWWYQDENELIVSLDLECSLGCPKSTLEAKRGLSWQFTKYFSNHMSSKQTKRYQVCFLAVQDSSIGDPVSHSVSHLLISVSSDGTIAIQYNTIALQ